MTTKILALAAAVTAAVTLSGCVTTLPDAERSYYDDISRAQNIARNFDYREDMYDSDAPEGYHGDGSFLLDAAGFAGSLNAASNINGFLPGVSGWGAVGIGLLGSFGQSMADSVKPQNKTGCFGYLPIEQAKDETEARKKMTKQIGDALLKSTQNLLPNAKVSYLDDFELKEKWWMDNTYGVLYDVVDPKIGCMHSDVPGTKGDNSCYFYVITQKTTKANGIHPMFKNADRSYYKLTHNKRGDMIVINDRLAKQLDPVKIYMNASKYLPENMFIYVPTLKNAEKKETPRMVIEKDRVDLFIKPPKKK